MNRDRIARVGPLVVAVLVGAALLRQTVGYGLVGFDSYPLILTSRVSSVGGLLAGLTQRLMDGRYPDAFYRPLLEFSVALDHALWGLSPAGYHLTSVLWFAACVLALAALARRLSDGSSWIAPLGAALCFALHPTHFEVLPVLARRAEILCCTFMILALYAELAPRRLAAGRPALGPALFTLLAIASKETAFLLPALVFLAVGVCGPRAGALRKLGYALVRTVPHLAVAAGMFAARLAILGGIGGHESTTFRQIAGNLPPALVLIFGGVALPAAPMHGAAGRWLLSGLLLAGAAALLIRAWGRKEDAPDPQDARGVRTACVALGWLALVALVQAAAGLVSPWHMFIPVAGWALLAGVAVEHLVRFVREGAGWAARGTAGLACGLLIALLLWQARFSPSVFHYDEWARASAAAEQFFDELRAEVAETPDGGVVQAPLLPFWISPKPRGATIEGAAILADYSVQAWSELVFPGRHVTVHYGKRNGGTPAANEVRVHISGTREDL